MLSPSFVGRRLGGAIGRGPDFLRRTLATREPWASREESKEQSDMMKLGLVILGLMTAPLFAWLMVPALMVIAALSPFLLGLAAVMLVCAPPRSAVKAAATSAEDAPPAPAAHAHVV
jgi:hypothetical protein